MAVAHESATESHTGTTGSASEASFDISVPFTANSKGLLVFTFCIGSSDNDATSVKIDPTGANTDVPAVSGGRAVDTAGENGDCKAWLLGAGLPGTTTTVRVNRTNNTNILYAVAITVTAAANVEMKGTPVLLEGDQAVAEQAVNSGAAAALRYAGLFTGQGTEPAAGASSTYLLGIDPGLRCAGTVVETTGGTGSRSVGFSVSIEDAAAVHLALGEVAGGGGVVEAEGASAGSADSAVVGATVFAGAIASTGEASVTAAGAARVTSTGSSAGVAVGAGIGAALAGGIAASAGVGAALAEGADGSAGGVASAAGVAAGAAVGAAIAGAAAQADGAGVSQGMGVAVILGVASASGTTSAVAVGGVVPAILDDTYSLLRLTVASALELRLDVKLPLLTAMTVTEAD